MLYILLAGPHLEIFVLKRRDVQRLVFQDFPLVLNAKLAKHKNTANPISTYMCNKQNLLLATI